MERRTRLDNPERRRQIIAAARSVFGEHGYTGTSTDQVAQAAGVSQPHVVRTFGTKERLFLEVADSALTELLDAFDAVIAVRPRPADLPAALGDAYVDLARQGEVHLVLLQAFVQGRDPAVGAWARAALLRVYAVLRENAGLDVETSWRFLAQGMMINVLLATDLVEQTSPTADYVDELLHLAFGDTAPAIGARGATTPPGG